MASSGSGIRAKKDAVGQGGDVVAESVRGKLLMLAAIFALGALLLTLVYASAPRLDANEKQYVKMPRSLDDAKALGRVLLRYRDRYLFTVLVGVATAYIFLQSFAIPGSIFLSILSGYLFPFPIALALICLCSACGASICYLLSHLIGRRLVAYYFPERIGQWCQQVSKHRDHLINYILFLRITPFLPNWFINIASPVLDVPLIPFFVGTLLGVAPPSCIFVQMGRTLEQLTTTTPQLSWQLVLMWIAMALASLAPILFKRRLKEKLS